MTASTIDPAAARQVVDALAEHEDAIGDLYDAYATLLTATASFWQGLSAEEYGHGSLMRDLAAREHELRRVRRRAPLSAGPVCAAPRATCATRSSSPAAAA